jgi:molecular chaperone DnaK
MDKIDILGIDLGTTNSAIASWDVEKGQPIVLSNREGERLTPSVVTFDTEMGTSLAGKPAMELRVSHPKRVIYSVKRFIGSTFFNERVRYDQEHVTYNIQETQQHKVIIQVGEQSFTPSQVSAEVLRKLKNDAEAALGRHITKAVITVPAYFNEAQRQATKEAGELAGLHVPRIINEPTAAALAFGLGWEPQTVAVYDMGGGTFDISILRIEHGLFRVKATGGDTHLGGDDIDLTIVQWLKEEFQRQHGRDLPVEENASLRALLRAKAALAKIALSSANEVRISIPQILATDEQNFDLNTTLSRTTFEERVQPLIDHSLAICSDVLKKAHMDS